MTTDQICPAISNVFDSCHFYEEPIPTPHPAMILPENILSKMSLSDRTGLPGGLRANSTAAESAAKYQAGEERVLQRDMANFFRHVRGLWFRTSAMNKKTTGKVGEPDFIGVYRGRMFGIECKGPGGKLSSEQGAELAAIREAGGVAVVAFAVSDAQEVLRDIDASFMHPTLAQLKQ